MERGFKLIKMTGGRILKRGGIALTAGMMALMLPVGSVQASTASRLNRVQQQKKNNENKLERTEDTIDDMKVEQYGLQEYLDKLSARLLESTEELSRIETLIEEKQKSMDEMRQDLSQAKASEKEQYEAMRQRIRFMYESSRNLYFDILFSAESFTGFLNQTQYIEKMTEYDRDMLANYKNLQTKIAKEERLLDEEQQGLGVLKQQADEKNENIAALVRETHEGVEKYRTEIAQKEKEALLLEEEIRRQEMEAEDLEEQLAKEIALSRQAASSEVRDLSGISFTATDLDLMAAIIECEAGGEPYVGKVAVGAVVLNRVKSSLFPDTVAGVLYQNRQFSPVGSGRFAIVLARGANASCYEAAQEAMNGSTPVGNCVFFRTPIPGLSGIQIGGHIFY